MKRVAIFLVVPLLAACQQEVISRHDSLSSQFAEMNKQGWAVDQSGRSKPVAAAADPNVRVIHEADFSGYQFHTNFQVDDPKYRSAAPPPPEPAAADPGAAGVNPWGAVPMAPR